MSTQNRVNLFDPALPFAEFQKCIRSCATEDNAGRAQLDRVLSLALEQRAERSLVQLEVHEKLSVFEAPIGIGRFDVKSDRLASLLLVARSEDDFLALSMAAHLTFDNFYSYTDEIQDAAGPEEPLNFVEIEATLLRAMVDADGEFTPEKDPGESLLQFIAAYNEGVDVRIAAEMYEMEIVGEDADSRWRGVGKIAAALRRG